MPAQRPPLGAVFVWAALLLAAAMPVVLTGCDRQSSMRFGGATQGTTYRVEIVAAADAQERELLRDRIEQRLAQIDAALSAYRPDSELNRFNAAPAQAWLPLGADLHRVLRAAQAISAQSDGAFDVTVAPLIDLWGFGAAGRPSAGRRGDLPDDAAIAAARAAVDYRQLELHPAEALARKRRPLRIDVNGIAQGYTVDCIADILAARGYRNFLVEVGGELRVAGTRAAGAPWRIGIERPGDGIGQAEQGIGGADIAITTAGDYHDYFEKDGVRYSHTIDPTTGRPVAHRLASVTVVANDATYADGMDTALEVLGPESGFALAERLKIAAYFIVRADDGFTVRYTAQMKPYLLAR